MDILTYNISWMAFNLALALLPVLFMVLFFATRNFVLRSLFLLLWFLFFPNTIYVITDLEHLISQWSQVGGSEKLLLLAQYGVLESVGLISFFIALLPFEKFARKFMGWGEIMILIILYNFMTGFAMELGKIERIHSIHVFTDPLRVLAAIIHTMQSWELITLVALFGLFTNLVYFLFRKSFMIIAAFFVWEKKKKRK